MNVEIHDSLDGQVALVTGGTRGIGERVATELAALGATVYVGARSVEDADASDRRAVQLDVTDEASVRAAVDRVAAETDALDVLVNNAGVYGPRGRLEALDPATVETTLQTNLHGPMRVTRVVLSRLGLREGGRIVNVSSGSGQFDAGIDASHLPYGVSKAGLNAFTNALAAQYDDHFVNAVCPGWVRTDMGGPSAPRSVEKGAETPVWLARFRDGPSGRLWRDKEPIPW